MAIVLIRIDESSPVPIYAQIAATVRREVAEGRVGAGERLPSARDLAGALGVNLHTVLRGYQELRDEGVVDLRRGRGAVVSARAAALAGPLQALGTYIEAARRAGLSATEAAELVKAGMS